MEEETELASKIFECDNCGEKVVGDSDGYWDEIDKERGNPLPTSNKSAEVKNVLTSGGK